jgi:hypothetical protein
MEVKVDIIDQDTKELLFERISVMSAKVYIAQTLGQVKMSQEWPDVPDKIIPGAGMRGIRLRRLWVHFPNKEADGTGMDPRLAKARKFWDNWSSQ